MKFRKKPVVIEAWQWLFNPLQEQEPTWVTDALNIWPAKGGLAFWPNGNGDGSRSEWERTPHLEIATLEGNHKAVVGDWIIKGVKGELYPCKPDIFAQTYEPAEEQ